MAGRVHQIDLIGLAIIRLVHQAHGLGLDRDAAFPLDIHGIEHLLFHIPVLDATAFLNQAVGKRRFTVVDMSDNREITDVREFCHGARNIRRTARRRNSSFGRINADGR